SRLVLNEEAQPGLAVHAAAGQGEIALAHRGVEGAPEGEERPEREREEQPITTGAETDDLKYPRPAIEMPCPAFGGVEPAQRLSRGAGGLVQPDVALDRVSQVVPVGRMRGLIGEQLA